MPPAAHVEPGSGVQKCRNPKPIAPNLKPSAMPTSPALDRPVPAGVNAAGFGSDVVADALRALDIPYIALNPGASYRGLHDSLVNYLGNERPQMLLCLHEEAAVAIAHGYAKVTGKAMAAAVHSNVGLMHATMAIFNAWCDRMPMLILGATGPVDAAKRRPWIDWIHTARDQGALIRDYTKWDDQPASPGAAREALLRATWIANTAPCGPTYINLDAEVQEGKLPAPLPPIDAKRYMPPVEARPPADAVKGGRAAASRQAAADPRRPRVAQSRRLERARCARRRARRPRRHRSQGRRRVPDRSSAACRCAGDSAPRPPTPSAPPDVILSLDWIDLGGTFKASAAATPKPRSSMSPSITPCTTAGAWTIRACRRSICSSPRSGMPRSRRCSKRWGAGRNARRAATRRWPKRGRRQAEHRRSRARCARRSATGRRPSPSAAVVAQRQLAVPPSARLSRLRRRRRRRRRPAFPWARRWR